MLLRLINSVRQKPKPVRDQFAFWIAVVFTVLVATPVLFGLPGRLDPASVDSNETDSQPMFSSFIDEVSGRFSEATEPVSDLREVIEGAGSSATTTSLIETIASSTQGQSARSVEREIRIATTTASSTQ